MKNYILTLFTLLISGIGLSQITLTHNVGNTPIKTDWENCINDEEYYARAFTLSDFGITTDEQFILNSAEIAISNVEKGSLIIINIYIIDENFPTSIPQRVSYGNLIETPDIGDKPEIIELKFSRPIVIPSEAKRILIEVQDFSSNKRF